MPDRPTDKPTPKPKPRHAWEPPVGAHKHRRCRRCGVECVTAPAAQLPGYPSRGRGIALYSPDGATWYSSQPGCLTGTDPTRPSWAREMQTDWGRRGSR